MVKNVRDIILTDKFPDRLLRHLLFWVGQYLFWTMMVVSRFFLDISMFEKLTSDLRYHSYFVFDIIYTYIVSYYLVDNLLAKNKRWKFSMALLSLTLVHYVSYILLHFSVYNLFGASRDKQFVGVLYHSTHYLGYGSPVICAMFLSLKFLKNYYLKTEENKLLISENTQSQLNLLKAQIHPHFLFNTLSNIHSFTITKTSVASDLISRLSVTLKYMIFDCEAPYVCLEKELAMLKDYIELQRVRYSNALSIKIEIDGDTRNKQIAPLFLIPLIENAFKHGTSQMLLNPWIHLKISITDSFLFMDLRNSKPNGNVPENHKSGIGLANVKKRLQLIYPNDHSLVVKSEEECFTAQIKIPTLTINEDVPMSEANINSVSKNIVVSQNVL